MARKLGNVPVGTVLHLQESGVYQDYIVVHQGLPSSMYNSSCNGTWLTRKTIPAEVDWGHDKHSYESSGLKPYMDEWPNVYAADIKEYIKQVTIPCNPSQISCKAFALSALEIGGGSSLYNEHTPPDGAVLSYFSGSDAQQRRIFQYVGEADTWFTRTAAMSTPNPRIVYVYVDGSFGWSNGVMPNGALPTIIMDPDAIVDDNNNILAALYPDPPASITVPTSSIPTGSSIAVSWSAVSGAESYQLQRSVDGSAWETVYTGTQTSYSDTAGVWNSVRYQVATVKVGIVSGYTTSTAVTILPYTIDKLTVPSQIMEGQTVPISWSAAPAATTYILERRVNSGSWTQIYSGANKSYTDTPSGSWSTVQYRVKGGANGQYGTYKTSPSIPVISASALVISGTDGYLGTLTADIGYTVSSDTGNPISVERYVNGQLMATVRVQSGFAYTIPVMDLPTGAGTVKIQASVNTSGGQVSATRTWTYDKKVVLFPEDGGPAQIQVEGKNLMPPTLAECIRVPTVWGGTMDKALELLLPLLSTAVMATGSYTGTGTFGSSSPNTLTFSFTPELVILSGGDVGLTISNTSPSGGTSDAYIQGTTAKWYSTSAAKQLNVQGKSYSYVAIGKAVQT